MAGQKLCMIRKSICFKNYLKANKIEKVNKIEKPKKNKAFNKRKKKELFINPMKNVGIAQKLIITFYYFEYYS